ncbi:MAG: hypothetical protein WCQ21_02600 [Verrucomicrobiota bacterium]
MESFEWQFGGGLQAWPMTAAAVLAVAALVGVWLVQHTYRRTLRELPRGTRWTLTALRGLVFLAVLFALANPVLVKKTLPSEKERRLAVLVDRSDSMSQPDNRGVTRLASAARLWQPHEAEAHETFARVEYFQFAGEVRPARDFRSATESAINGAETRLVGALGRAVEQSPDAIVCLTDGLDTSGEATDSVASQAQQRGVPLYFVPGHNRLRAGRKLRLREVKIPGQVARQTRFTVSALVEWTTDLDQPVPVELWGGDRLLESARLPVHPGLNLIPWSAQVTAGEPGAMPLEIRAGSGPDQQIAGSSSRIVNLETVEVLYYQGALQWGYRTLRDALESDPGFRITAILNPALNVTVSLGPDDQPSLPDLPEEAAKLKGFHVVILANVFAHQLTPGQQAALIEYVRGGGSVLFISPETEATREFSGTAIEQMLPVVFESPSAPAGVDTRAARFRQTMQGIAANEDAPELGPLVPFQAAEGQGAKLFQPGPNAPRFCTYAKVARAKAGAEIVAVHPRDRSTVDGQPCILVARQAFGNGHSAVLNTDPLWRWKLSLPSTERTSEIFWQQFMLSLAALPPKEGLQLLITSEDTAVKQPLNFQVSAPPGSGAPQATSVSPSGTTTRLTLSPLSEKADAAGWQGTFTPDVKGRWEVRATKVSGETARATAAVAERTTGSLEHLRLPTDEAGLRRLAEATGGAVIESSARVFRPAAQESRPGLETRQTHALWHSPWALALLLGAFATELITRRVFRLL